MGSFKQCLLCIPCIKSIVTNSHSNRHNFKGNKKVIHTTKLKNMLAIWTESQGEMSYHALHCFFAD